MTNYYLLTASICGSILSLVEMFAFRINGWYVTAIWHAGFTVAFLLAAIVCWQRIKEGRNA